jgi:transcription termination factor Rho
VPTAQEEVDLQMKIADRRIYPAIDIFRSGTRKEELLLSQAEINRVILLRQFLADMPEAEAIEFLLRQMVKSKNNKEFFAQMAQG